MCSNKNNSFRNNFVILDNGLFSGGIRSSRTLFGVITVILLGAFAGDVVGQKTQGLTPYLTYEGKLNETVTNAINKTYPHIYSFTFDNETESIRIKTNVNNTDGWDDVACPVMFTLRQSRSTKSWALPLNERFQDSTGQPVDTKSYQGAFTVCLEERTEVVSEDNDYEGQNQDEYEFLIFVTTCNAENIFYDLTVLTSNSEYLLELDQPVLNVALTPTVFQFFRFNFPDTTDQVVVQVTSDSNICMTAAVQSPVCRLLNENSLSTHDKGGETKFKAFWQDMSKRAVIPVTRSDFPHGFFIAFNVHANDDRCLEYQGVSADSWTPISAVLFQENGSIYDSESRRKLVTIDITSDRASMHYAKPIIFPVIAVLFMVGVTAVIFSVFYCISVHHERRGNGRDRCIEEKRFLTEDDELGQNFEAGQDQPHVTFAGCSSTSGPGSQSHQTRPDDVPTRCPFLEEDGSNDPYAKLSAPAHHDPLPGPSRPNGNLKKCPYTPAVANDLEASVAVNSNQILNSSVSPAPSGESVPAVETHKRCPYGQANEKVFQNTVVLLNNHPVLVHRQDTPTRERFLDQEDSDENEAYSPTPVEVNSRNTIKTDIETDVNQDEISAEPSTSINSTVTTPNHQDETLSRFISVQLNSTHMASPAGLRGSNESMCSNDNSDWLTLKVFFRKKKVKKSLDKVYMLIGAMGIFYILPTVQLLYTYHRITDTTGQSDLCYRNFLCSHKIYGLEDFNHIYSNIVYVLLAAVFCIFVRMYDGKIRRLEKFRLGPSGCSTNDEDDVGHGVVHHWGVHYALGMAMAFEGLMSALYHVCPTRMNFQFDTSFMFILATVCAIKIYQFRHPNPICPHNVFGFLALISFISVGGIILGSKAYAIMFIILHLVLVLVLSVYLYLIGYVREEDETRKLVTDSTIFQKSQLFKKFTEQSMAEFCRPKHKSRIFLLVIVLVYNLSINISQILGKNPFPMYLVYLFAGNMMLYFVHYVLMKLWHGEVFNVLTIQPLLYCTFSVTMAVFGIIYFKSKTYNANLSPAASRALNDFCIIEDFYDPHDLWHFLSAGSIFFFFMTLLTLDDGILQKPRKEIVVF